MSARVEIIQGVNFGRNTATDGSGAYRLERLNGGAMRVRVSAANYIGQEIDVPLSANLTLNFELTPAPTPVRAYLYSGIVSDGTGRPVAGVTVRGGPDSAVTDANGRYEFRSQYPSVPGNLYPPTGYERKPVRPTDSFPLTPGQNLTVRRITSVSISPPSTLTVGSHLSVNAQISFDTGQVESPTYDYFVMTASDITVLKVGSGHGQGYPFVEGVNPGTASVSGTYFGVSSTAKYVQVTPSA